MTSADIIKRIMNIWGTDPEVQGFCMDAWGKKPRIRGYVNPDKPISEGDFPLITFYGSRTAGGMTRPAQKFEFLVGFAVSDDEIEVFDDWSEFSVGLERVQALRDLAEWALYKAKIGKITWEGEEDPLIAFPVFTATSVITVEMPNTKPRI